MRKEYTLQEILDTEEGRAIIDELDELVYEEDGVSMKRKRELLAKLRNMYGYVYQI